MNKKKLPPAPRALFQPDCPQKYTGPIEDATGKRPYNGYLWPLQSWWLNNELGMQNCSSRYRFGYVYLAAGVCEGGRFVVSGHIRDIEANSRRCSWDQKPGQLPRPNNFPTRAAAIRTAAADLLRLARSARRWEGYGGDHLRDPDRFAEVVNWVRAVVAKQTKGRKPKLMAVPTRLPQAPPAPQSTGLELLDLMLGVAA